MRAACRLVEQRRIKIDRESRSLVSRARARKERAVGGREGGEGLAGCLTEARWRRRRRRRSGAVVADVEVPEYSHLNSDSGVDVSARER